MSGKVGGEIVKQITGFIAKTNRYESVLRKLQITAFGDGKCTCEFKVSEEHVNQLGILHGGFTATLIDNVTTYALMSKNGNRGVSVDLRVSYLKGARENDEVIVDAKIIRAGKILAFIDCELRHKKDGSLIARGGQTKYVATKA